MLTDTDQIVRTIEHVRRVDHANRNCWMLWTANSGQRTTSPASARRVLDGLIGWTRALRTSTSTSGLA